MMDTQVDNLSNIAADQQKMLVDDSIPKPLASIIEPTTSRGRGTRSTFDRKNPAMGFHVDMAVDGNMTPTIKNVKPSFGDLSVFRRT